MKTYSTVLLSLAFTASFGQAKLKKFDVFQMDEHQKNYAVVKTKKGFAGIKLGESFQSDNQDHQVVVPEGNRFVY
jgi:glucan biosynthesis protein